MSDLQSGRYRHFKGKDYELVGLATDSESLQPVVIYRALYGECGLWVRPLTMFTEAVTRDGIAQPRFQWQGE